MRKPKELKISYKYPFNSDTGYTEAAKVFEDFYSEDFSEEGDPISVRYDAKLMGESMFDGYGPKDQINIARKMARWLIKYADWLEYRYKNQNKLKIKIEA